MFLYYCVHFPRGGSGARASLSSCSSCFGVYCFPVLFHLLSIIDVLCAMWQGLRLSSGPDNFQNTDTP
ncbi:hypothetical protein P168DRAFT_33471 [Aspergillus campestris IBT 28561]|uniref:Uncharacterized protein n=1 Tax=Aspergillus campestris (strain IBT 28561) TaxID=1392248 RepID=A0A2I1DHA7_ASPC2|nr:uncharacterized protein P168DRAFT_33471 [Aspergillus campestris IBT 28561]PKY09257.1 hypothetical protein P168DRAFT_33471 [Aspergillus campestris IBT 28561]